MKRMAYGLVGLFVVCGVIIAGCAQKPVAEQAESMETWEPVQGMSLAEQKKQAYDIFKQILWLSDGPEREKHLPEIKALYREIIGRYPEIALAQESYLRLVILAKEEGTAAGDAEAERLYREFSVKYPDSKLMKIIENELAKD